MTARRVPDRPAVRCHVSRWPISAAERALRAAATPAAEPSGEIPLASRSQIWACSRSSAAMLATSGELPWAS